MRIIGKYDKLKNDLWEHLQVFGLSSMSLLSEILILPYAITAAMKIIEYPIFITEYFDKGWLCWSEWELDNHSSFPQGTKMQRESVIK